MKFRTSHGNFEKVIEISNKSWEFRTSHCCVCVQPRRRPMVNMPGRIPMHERTAGDKGRNRSCPPNPAAPNREPPHWTRPPGTSPTLRPPALGASTWGLQFLQPKSMGPGLVTTEVAHSRHVGQAPTLYQLARSGRASLKASRAIEKS